MFQSKVQMDRCRQLVADKKMSQEEFDRHFRETDHKNLPERKHPKKEKR